MLEDEELVFDPMEFEEKVDSVLQENKRYIAIDLSQLDYLYSDGINKLINVNQKVVKKSGYFVLLSPIPKVREILVKAKIEKQMKLVASEEELSSALTDDNTSETSIISNDDVKSYGTSGQELSELNQDFNNTLAIDAEDKPDSAFAPSTNEIDLPVKTPTKEPTSIASLEKTLDYKKDQLESFSDGAYKREEENKSSFFGFLMKFAIVLIIIGGLGAGGYYGYQKGWHTALLGEKEEQITKEELAKITEDAAKKAAADALAEQRVQDSIRTAEQAIQKAKEDSVQAYVDSLKAIAEAKKSPKKVATTTKRPAKRPIRESKPQVWGEPSKKSVISFASNVTGAEIYVNGRFVGKTPFDWRDPSVSGSISIEMRKDGYETKSKSTRYSGGEDYQFIRLTQKTAVSNPTPVNPKSTNPNPKPITSTPKPITPTPKPQNLGGAPGTIFISTLPPKAKIYLNGKMIGISNVNPVKITAGTHTVRFEKNGKTKEEQMTFKAGKNPPKMVRF